MKVLSLGWLGVRTAQFEAMSAFYRDVLGLEKIGEDSSSSRFLLADQTEVHVYGGFDEFHTFFGSAPVVAFQVESFREAQTRMLESGIAFLYPEPQRHAGRAWQHFRAPDGNVYEIMGPDDLADGPDSSF